ncbi:unnamed protein product [Paramecium octaurelia]|uniref:Uncharacterized protein n=1 Tax=Paramecium octaurelia TaxID=43137 RepID=A0A8S1WRN7_PAROT|nr:unnamed protein product [Paramecium octaurelia]
MPQIKYFSKNQQKVVQLRKKFELCNSIQENQIVDLNGRLNDNQQKSGEEDTIAINFC